MTVRTAFLIIPLLTLPLIGQADLEKSELDVKKIYYRSLGLKYNTEFAVLIPPEMSMLDSRVAKKLIEQCKKIPTRVFCIDRF